MGKRSSPSSKKCSHFLNVSHNKLKLCWVNNFDLFFSFLEIMLKKTFIRFSRLFSHTLTKFGLANRCGERD